MIYDCASIYKVCGDELNALAKNFPSVPPNDDVLNEIYQLKNAIQQTASLSYAAENSFNSKSDLYTQIVDEKAATINVTSDRLCNGFFNGPV